MTDREPDEDTPDDGFDDGVVILDAVRRDRARKLAHAIVDGRTTAPAIGVSDYAFDVLTIYAEAYRDAVAARRRSLRSTYVLIGCALLNLGALAWTVWGWMR